MGSYYPVMLQLQGHKCVVVGGGTVGERKLIGLLEAGADRIVVVGLSLTKRITELADAQIIEIQQRVYNEADVADAMLVIAATDNRALNKQIVQDAVKAGALVNAADDEKVSSFITPAVVRRGALVLTVSASGASPALASRIRNELASRYGEEYASIAAKLGNLRQLVKSRTVMLPEHRSMVLQLAAEEAAGGYCIQETAEEWMNRLQEQINRSDSINE